MLRIWESCKRFDRPQDVFRAMLRNGMRAMVQSGEMPYAVVEECNLDAFIEKWLARQPAAKTLVHTPVAAPVAYDRPVQVPPQVYAPAYHEPVSPPGRESRPTVVEQPEPRQRSAEVDHRPIPEKEIRPSASAPVQTERPALTTAPPADKSKSSGKRIGDLM